MTNVQRRKAPIDQAPADDSATPPDPRAPVPPRRLEAGPPAPVVVLPMSAVRLETLGVGELLDLAEKLGTDLEGLADLMKTRGAMRARFLVGLVWILARRDDPTLAYDAVERWRIEVEVTPDPTTAAPPNGARPGL